MAEPIPAVLAGARHILDTAPLAIVAVGRDGRIVWANGQFEELFDYAQHQVLGETLEVLIPERLRSAHVRHRADFFMEPRVRPMGLGLDLTARRRDGSEFPVEISLSHIGSGQDLLALAFVVDVTQRREAERRLQTEFALTSVFLERLPIEEAPARLLEVICRSLGWPAGELWHVDGGALRHGASWNASGDASEAGRTDGPDLPARARATMRAVWADDDRTRGLEDGTSGPGAACAFPIRGNVHVSAVMVLRSHTPRAPDESLLAMLTDIGRRMGQHLDLRRAEHELERQRDVLYQSEKLTALGRLVAGVAHEMNNPLGIMSSRIELMLADAEGQSVPAQLLDDLRVLHRNTRRVAGVAQALRSFARQSGGQRQPMSLNGVVEETLLLVGRPSGAADVAITVALDPELPPLLGDANALQQVVLNLITNAREAMAGGGQIRIETGPAPDRPGQIQLVVRDTGPGIASADLPHIFEPFYTTKPAGTGLGLAVSYGIVQDHRGTIDVESPLGGGTVFVLRFPALPSGHAGA